VVLRVEGDSCVKLAQGSMVVALCESGVALLLENVSLGLCNEKIGLVLKTDQKSRMELQRSYCHGSEMRRTGSVK
jgi:hypothetical protein